MLEKIKEIAADSLGADVSTMTAEPKQAYLYDSRNIFQRRSRSRFP